MKIFLVRSGGGGAFMILHVGIGVGKISNYGDKIRVGVDYYYYFLNI